MKRSNILPSRWVQRLIIILAAMGLIAAFILTSLSSEDQNDDQEQALAISFLESQDLEKDIDTDKDGVPDWEERLWGLDPLLVDTDADGVSDARYIQNKKNVQERRILGIENIETTLSESDKLGRSVYAALLAVEQTGGEIDDKTQDQISDNIVDYISNISVGGVLYLRENLNLVENSKENTYRYRDELEGLLESYPIEPGDIELIIVSVEDKDPYRADIARVAERYDILLGRLAGLDVPYIIAGRHTELLNSMAHITGALKNLNQEESDDFVSFSVVVQMEEVLAQVSDTSNYLQKFFDIIADESIFNE